MFEILHFMCNLCVLVKRESQIVEVDSGKFPNGQVTGCHSKGKQKGAWQEFASLTIQCAEFHNQTIQGLNSQVKLCRIKVDEKRVKFYHTMCSA